MDGIYFVYDPEKDARLSARFGINFEQIIDLLEEEEILRVSKHHNTKKYAHQFIYEVLINGYVYVVPAVKEENKVFLKTFYPSRKATKRYKGDNL